MAAAVELKGEWGSEEFRRLAAKAKDGNQARRLLALAAIRDGKSRAEAARIGGMDRQTLRDWVHAVNARGLDGLINRKAPGRKPKLGAEQKEEVREIVERGPDPEVDGVVRWRCVDLRGVINKRFGVDLDEVSIGRLLKELGFAHVSARPRPPKQDKEAVETFKKTSPPRWQSSRRALPRASA
jgi:transposase